MNKNLKSQLSKEEISILFNKGKTLTCFPFRVNWLPGTANEKTRYLITVPKRNFKKAIDRNKIKRQLKEIYLSKIEKTFFKNKSYILVITYINDKKLLFHEYENTLLMTFHNFIDKNK